MIPSFLRRGSALLLGVLLLGVGCGPKVANVDLKKQMDALSGNSDAKVAALAEISTLGAEARPALDKIIALLKDEDPVVRRTAAFALGAMGPAAKAAVADLKALLQTTDRDQMTAAANALNSIDPSSMKGVKVENTSN